MTAGLKNYFLVTKPAIILGNLISAAGGFFLASRGIVEGGVLLVTLAGTGLVAASGCVLNNIVDRHLDRVMTRTHNRVLARGLMSPAGALAYAASLGLAGTVLLWTTTNKLCVAVIVSGLVIYVPVYSLYLKRRSIYATLIGSLAGAAPPLAGYCAVSQRFDLGAVILLAIFSLWQIPHSYSIALFRLKDYTAAAIPVLPVEKGTATAKRHIIWYIPAFLIAALMPTVGGYTGYAYLVAAVVMGLSWLVLAWSGYRTSDDRLWGRKLFLFSILSITVLSVMMSIDFKTAPAANMLLALNP